MERSTVITDIYPVHSTLFNLLNVADIIRLAKTNTRLRNLLYSYTRRAYDIEAQLLDFLPDPDSFRELQFYTGVIISGSFALQFFTRETRPDMSLDIFVGSRSQEQVGGWLLRHGFFYSPVKLIRGGVEETQAPYSDAIKCPGFRAIPSVQVLDTLDFVRVVDGTERKVVLHVTCFSPVETVLLFPFSEFTCA